jgi:pilus assembly protein Flp/PilA
MNTVINMLHDDRGASAAEYALILAIIGGLLAIMALALGNAISNALSNSAACIRTATTGTC